MSVVQSVQVCPTVFLIYFLSTAVILLGSVALMIQFSLPYSKVRKASVLYNFTCVFFVVFCSLNLLLLMPVIYM